MKHIHFTLAAAAFIGVTAFAEEPKAAPTNTTVVVNRQVPVPVPAAPAVVSVEQTGGERLFTSTGSLIDGTLKLAALPFEWLGCGLDAITPKRYRTVPVVRPVRPVVRPVPVVPAGATVSCYTGPAIQSVPIQAYTVGPAPVVTDPYFQSQLNYWYGPAYRDAYLNVYRPGCVPYCPVVPARRHYYYSGVSVDPVVGTYAVYGY